MSALARSRAIRAVLLACLATTTGLGCQRDVPGDILLITVDTLRADHLSIYGYARDTSPNLERWFGGGTVFERAYATSAYTSSSTASLLSGRLPQHHRVRLFDQPFPQDVALVTELLPDAYQSAAVISTKILSDAATGMAARFDHFDDAIAADERTAAPTTDAALDWLARQRDPARPAFLWVHYKDPHAPYAPPPSHRGSYRHERPSGLPLDRIPTYARLEGESDPLGYVDRYDEEIAHTDVEIGRLLEGYAALADLDRALLLLTADHGESLIERPFWFVHANHVFEEQVRVPLLLRGPGVVSVRRRDLVSGIDVLPTLLSFAGAARPGGLPGLDLRGAAVPEDRVVFAESIHYLNGRQWRAAIQGDRKWMVVLRATGDLVHGRRHYDLAADPAERKPLPWSEEGPGRELLALVAADPDPAGMPRDAERGRLLDENPQLLKALGYAR